MNPFAKFVFYLALSGVTLFCKAQSDTMNTVNTSNADSIVEESYFNSDTTLFAKGHLFSIATIDPDLENSDTLLVLVKRDSLNIFTTYIDKGGLCDQELIDFNNDGYFDIMFYRGQQMGDHELYLYDPLNNTFVKSIGFERIREPVQLKSNPNYWYSYCRAGCADMNWTSKLFTFKNFETVEIGYIYGQGCESDEEPQIITIYKVLDNDEDKLKPVKELPYSILDHNAGKWNFIEEYWNDNYKKFKQ